MIKDYFSFVEDLNARVLELEKEGCKRGAQPINEYIHEGTGPMVSILEKSCPSPSAHPIPHKSIYLEVLRNFLTPAR